MRRDCGHAASTARCGFLDGLLRGLGLPFLVCAVLGSSCTVPTAGTGTETSAGEKLGKVGGTVVTSSGTPAAGAVVTAVPVSYHPAPEEPLPDSFTTLTDDSGRYVVDALPVDRYNMQAILPENGTRCLVRDVEVDSGAVAQAPQGILRRTGIAIVNLPATSAALIGARLVLEGTTRLVNLDSAAASQRRAVLDSLPAGLLPAVRIVTTSLSARLASSLTIQEDGAIDSAQGTGGFRSLLRFTHRAIQADKWEPRDRFRGGHRTPLCRSTARFRGVRVLSAGAVDEVVIGLELRAD